ncbi:hypothetical protein FB451DRAFT_1556599 [Mycena latifolia]|nr:hypothetical protein FB451DRAFT_1556599 [Mycena latifolia]
MKLILSCAQLGLLLISMPAVLAYLIHSIARADGVANKIQHIPFRNYPSESAEDDENTEINGAKNRIQHIPFRNYPSEEDDGNITGETIESRNDESAEYVPFS